MRHAFQCLSLTTLGIAASIAAVPVPLLAQTSGVGAGIPRTTQSLQPAKPDVTRAAVDARLPVPAPEQLLGLLRSTVIALNQANQTGNYTVLRDLAAPDFRNGNDASKLGAIFQVLRDQAVDLTPLLQITPEVVQAPMVDANGLLRLTGFFPTEPLRVNFDLSFQMSDNRWRPYTISVYLVRLEARAETPVLKPVAPAVKKPPPPR